MLLAVSEMHQKVFQQSKMELYFLYNASMLEIFRNGIYVWFVHINILVCLTASLHCTDITGQSLQVQTIKRPYFEYLNWIEVICFIVCILLLTVCLSRMSKCLRLRFLVIDQCLYSIYIYKYKPILKLVYHIKQTCLFRRLGLNHLKLEIMIALGEKIDWPKNKLIN